MPTTFTALEREAWGGFLRAYARLNRLIEEDLQSHARITHAEFEVLLRLVFSDEHRMRLQDLAAQSLLTRSGVTRVVERLEKAGLVVREAASEDRRGAYAALTPAGEERFTQTVEPHTACVREHFLSHFNKKELAQLAEFWGRLEASDRPSGSD